MMKELIFGAAYYLEYAQEDRLERDMQLMREAGMNTIRIAESTWSVEEPSCGAYDFSAVTRVIEAAARHGICVIVGTPTYAIPKWLADLDPEILGENRFGPRQNMDITNPTYRLYAERIIRALVSLTAPYPNVVGFQIDNETKHYNVCNERVVQGFRDWLKARFGTVEALNRAYLLNHWSNSVASFDELPDPRGTVNGGYACAFEEYRRELAAEFLRWQAGIVGEYKRGDQFITHNFDYDWHSFVAPNQQGGQSAGLQPDQNDYEAAKAVTLAGTDIYCPPADGLTGWEIAFGGDLMRPLKKAPYLVLESQSQAFTGWLPYPGQLRLMAMSHLASGACGLMYWPWASLHGGIESYWKGILSHDGEPAETYAEVRQIGAELRRVSAVLDDAPEQNRIALIVSPEALHALRWFPTGQSLSYNDVVNRFHRALYELNLECDVLYDRETDWSGYRLLIFPELYCASASMIERVRAFVKEGGTVFASFRSFFADENLRIYHDRQPHGLTDVFGMHYSRFTKDRDHEWMELLEPDSAAVLARYGNPHWSQSAAFTRSRFGAGEAWYLGCTVSAELLKDCLSRAALAAGLPRPPLGWPLIVRRRGGLCFVFNYSGEARSFPCPADGTDVLSGARYTLGQSCTLGAWQLMMIRQMPEAH